MQRIAVVGSDNHMDHSALPIFILKKTPITSGQASAINTLAADKGFTTLYTPSGVSTDSVLKGLARSQISVNDLISQAAFNMKPATDDNPFFYNFDLGIPSTLIYLLSGAITLSIVVSILYAAARRREKVTFQNGKHIKLRSKFSTFRWYIFASLGLGFMLIEVALIQKFILYLGEPTLAIAASLFSLLLAGGLGSFFSRKWSNGKQINAFKISLIIAAIVITYVFTMPVIFNATLSYSAWIRFIVSFMLISPLGFLMGIPFPIVLGYIKQEYENDSAWMWCINGAFSVLAGVLALVIAMTYGFNAVLWLGALTYAGVFLIGRRHEENAKVGKIKWINPQAPKFKTTWQKGKRINKQRF